MRDSNALPQLCFGVQSGLFVATEVPTRDDPDETPAVNDRKMAVAAILHTAKRFERRVIGSYRIGILSHDLGELRPVRIDALRDDPVDHIAFGEDAFKAFSGYDQHSTHMPVAHLASRFAHRRCRGQVEQVLIVNDLGDDLAVHVPPHCGRFCNTYCKLILA